LTENAKNPGRWSIPWMLSKGNYLDNSII
jgi:hypothetical protein